jgi:pullulanase/glycogen debranching enzyme
MLLIGDEVCRTQSGNNNAYCQDLDSASSTGVSWSGMPTSIDL